MINLKNTQPTTSNKNQFSLTSVLPLGIMLLFSMTPVSAQVSRRPSPTMQTPPSTTPVTSAKTQPAETAHKFTTAEIRAKLLGKSSLTVGQRVINPHVNATLSALAQQIKTAQAGA